MRCTTRTLHVVTTMCWVAHLSPIYLPHLYPIYRRAGRGQGGGRAEEERDAHLRHEGCTACRPNPSPIVPALTLTLTLTLFRFLIRHGRGRQGAGGRDGRRREAGHR